MYNEGMSNLLPKNCCVFLFRLNTPENLLNVLLGRLVQSHQEIMVSKARASSQEQELILRRTSQMSRLRAQSSPIVAYFFVQ